MAIRIIIADDHKLFREGLHSLLEKLPGVEIIGEADNGRDTIQLVSKLSPHIVIMDISMPGLNGIEATVQLSKKCPNTKVIALSMHSDRRFVTEMLKAGAYAYLVKDCARKDLEDAIRAVSAGQKFLSPQIAGVVISDYVQILADETEAPEADKLSSREREVLQLIAEGKNVKEIALILDISPKTVEFHRKRIMNKVGAKTIAELTKYAIKMGFTSL
ncbi:MAG: response regulator transcription factor [bacterium]|jgi:DNA-binding NarL/FixJ family response regulator